MDNVCLIVWDDEQMIRKLLYIFASFAIVQREPVETQPFPTYIVGEMHAKQPGRQFYNDTASACGVHILVLLRCVVVELRSWLRGMYRTNNIRVSARSR